MTTIISSLLKRNETAKAGTIPNTAFANEQIIFNGWSKMKVYQYTLSYDGNDYEMAKLIQNKWDKATQKHKVLQIHIPIACYEAIKSWQLEWNNPKNQIKEENK